VAVAQRDEEGGLARASLKIYVGWLRKALQGTPFTVANQWGVGYGLFLEKDCIIHENLAFHVWVRLRPASMDKLGVE
jgi:hypothetical protein